MSRWLLSAFASTFVAACGAGKPIDCAAREKEVFACVERNRGQVGELAILEKCIPLAKAERFRGTWAVAFEFNQFHNGKVLRHSQAWQYPEVSTSLIIEGSGLEKYVTERTAAVLDITFVGRRTACNLTEPNRQIVVSRIIDIQPIEVLPPEWWDRLP